MNPVVLSFFSVCLNVYFCVWSETKKINITDYRIL